MPRTFFSKCVAVAITFIEQDFQISTKCLEDTLLTWIPASFLWIYMLVYVARASSKRKVQQLDKHNAKQPCLHRPSKTSILFLGKCFGVINLFILYVFLIVGFWKTDPLTTRSANVIKAFCCLLVIFIQFREQKIGRTTSDGLTVYWILCSKYSFFVSLNVLFLVFQKGDKLTSLYYISAISESMLIIFQLVLTLFSETSSPSQRKPYRDATLHSRMSYDWLTKFMKKFSRKRLEMKNLLKLASEYRPYLAESISSVNGNEGFTNFSVKKYIFVKHWKSFILFLTVLNSSTLVYFLQILITERLICYVDSDEPVSKGCLYIIVMLLVRIYSVSATRYAEYLFREVSLKIKWQLSYIIYLKLLRLSTRSRSQFGMGKVLNLVASDACKIVTLSTRILIAAVGPGLLLLTGFCMGMLLGKVTLMGFAVILMFLPVLFVSGSKLKHHLSEFMKAKDKRLKRLSEVFSYIRIIKLFAWEHPFLEMIEDLKNSETSILMKTATLQALLRSIGECTPMLVSISCFLSFTLLSKNVLTPEIAFTSLTTITMLKWAVILLPDLGVIALDLRISFNRIQQFLDSEEQQIVHQDLCSSESTDILVSLKNVTASWNPDKEPVLRDISLSLKSNNLVMVIGTVGSGKSSLLAAIVRDLYITEGDVTVNGKIGYVPQEPWIQNMTARENVLFTSKWNQKRYDQIIQACCLQPDFDIFPFGDLSEIGERGINISGGQKQRISLARAVYQDNDVYLLDDSLSAVDSHVATALFDNVIGPNGILKNKLRILVTNNIVFLSRADLIIVLKGGTVSEMGFYNELLKKQGYMSALVAEYLNENKNKQRDTTRNKETENSPFKKGVFFQENFMNNLTNEEFTESGNVKFSTYYTYIRNAGIVSAFLILLLDVSNRGLDVSSGIWLSIWSMDTDPSRTLSYAIVYTGLGVFVVALFFCFCLLLFKSTTTSANKLHKHMLHSVFRAPLLFFDTTPIGRLLNRFGMDIEQLEISFPSFLSLLLFNTAALLSIFILTCLKLPLFNAVVVVLLTGFYVLFRLFQNVYLELQRLISISVSPVYSHISETFQGLTSIRSYCVEQKFFSSFVRKSEVNLNCSLHMIISSLWFRYRSELITHVGILSVSFLIVLRRDILSPGDAGLVLAYFLNSSTLLNQLFLSASHVENSFVAVERIKEYSETTPEGDWRNERHKTWHSDGSIKLTNYCARYREGLDLVLKNISISIMPSEKIGVVGRTGSGKSSLILALYRLIQQTGGKIHFSGIDASDFGLHDLREKLTIIPQEPVLFTGTLRYNLDPMNEHSDPSLMLAIERAHLKDSFPDGLMTTIAEGGQNLSVGQRQLVCLARALAKSSKILLMDEATSSVDLETDSKIQQTIRQDFQHYTVVTIAHRIQTVLDYDRIIVMERGSVVETGSPNDLLKSETSLFYHLAMEAGISPKKSI